MDYLFYYLSKNNLRKEKATITLCKRHNNMNSYLIKHILLLFVWIPFSWLSAASVQDAESRKAALMLFYAQVKQEPAAALPKLDSLEKTGTFSKGYIDFFRSCAYQALSKYYMSMYYA